MGRPLWAVFHMSYSIGLHFHKGQYKHSQLINSFITKKTSHKFFIVLWNIFSQQQCHLHHNMNKRALTSPLDSKANVTCSPQLAIRDDNIRIHCFMLEMGASPHASLNVAKAI